MATLALRVVAPAEDDVFNTQFAVHVDENGVPDGIVIITDGPVEDSESADALAEVIDFTEGIVEMLKQARASLTNGTATEIHDSKKD